MLDLDQYAKQKGVSVVIGAILMFGIAIIALSIYQASAVPQQNQNIEFQHYNELRSDMVNYNTTIDQTKTIESASTTLTLSKPYPSRVVTVNPPPFTTKISILEQQQITVSNFEVEGSPNEELYWSQREDYSIPNSIVKVEPDYYEWQDSGVYWYENQNVYSEEPNATNPVLLDETNFIQDTSLTLHGYTGTYSGPSSEETRIKVSQISGSESSLYITGVNNNTPIQVQINTRLPEVVWREILNVSSSDQIEYVSYDDSAGILTIELDPKRSYNFEGYLSATNPSTDLRSLSDPEYITNSGGNTVASGQNITLSVHDELGNTVSNAIVTVEDNPNNCVSTDEKRTNSRGEVIFTCDTNQDRQITFSINNGVEDYETVTVDVQRSSGGGGNQPPGQNK